MINIEDIIKKAIKNNRQISTKEIEELNLTEQEYELLYENLVKSNINIVESNEINEYTNEFNCSCRDSLKMYYKEIGKIPLLTLDEEKELTIKAKQGDILAKNKLIESNLRLVVSIAKKYTSNTIELSDLIQEGNLGLIKTIKNYDPNKGYKFSTYASWYIQSSVRRYALKHFKIINIPIKFAEDLEKLKKVELNYGVSKGKILTNKELSHLTGISEEKINLAKRVSKEISSLDLPTTEGSETPLIELIADNKQVENEAILKIYMEYIYSLMKRVLTSKECEILYLRNEIKNKKVMTLDELGMIYGVTKERVRQIEKKAYEKIKKELEKDLQKNNITIFDKIKTK